MAAFGPPLRRILSICTALLAVGMLFLLVAQPVPAENTDSPADPPQASLQDPPDLVIFHTGEVRGVLLPGG